MVNENTLNSLVRLSFVFLVACVINLVLVFVDNQPGIHSSDFFLGVPVPRPGNTTEIVLKSTVPLYAILSAQALCSLLANQFAVNSPCYKDEGFCDTGWDLWKIFYKYAPPYFLAFASGLLAFSFLVVSGETSWMVLALAVIMQTYVIIIAIQFLDSRQTDPPKWMRRIILSVITFAVIGIHSFVGYYNIAQNSNECKIGTFTWYVVSSVSVNFLAYRPYVGKSALSYYLWGQFLQQAISNVVLFALLLDRQCHYTIVDV
jgi:hypothetical protein